MSNRTLHKTRSQSKKERKSARKLVTPMAAPLGMFSKVQQGAVATAASRVVPSKTRTETGIQRDFTRHSRLCVNPLFRLCMMVSHSGLVTRSSRRELNVASNPSTAFSQLPLPSNVAPVQQLLLAAVA